jgi:hypothetical protein
MTDEQRQRALSLLQEAERHLKTATQYLVKDTEPVFVIRAAGRAAEALVDVEEVFRPPEDIAGAAEGVAE